MTEKRVRAMVTDAKRSDALRDIAGRTIAHYDEHAEGFWRGTKDHDVTQNYQAFMAAMPPGRALDILDFGCGPGRDLLYFKEQGHQPVGLDGSLAFCRMARSHADCVVYHQNFLELDLPDEAFDGIFANAALFHVPSSDFTRVLRELCGALRAGGILFSSNPRGDYEGWSEGRYGYFMELEQYRTHLREAGFVVLSHYYRPHGQPRLRQPWLAVLSAKAPLAKKTG